jgi:hypothetical protein
MKNKSSGKGKLNEGAETKPRRTVEKPVPKVEPIKPKEETKKK